MTKGTMTKPKNALYYGDNLDVMKNKLVDEIADLIYLDPPFKSDINYNMLFKSMGSLPTRPR